MIELQRSDFSNSHCYTIFQKSYIILICSIVINMIIWLIPPHEYFQKVLHTAVLIFLLTFLHQGKKVSGVWGKAPME